MSDCQARELPQDVQKVSESCCNDKNSYTFQLYDELDNKYGSMTYCNFLHHIHKINVMNCVESNKRKCDSKSHRKHTWLILLCKANNCGCSI